MSIRSSMRVFILTPCLVCSFNVTCYPSGHLLLSGSLVTIWVTCYYLGHLLLSGSLVTIRVTCYYPGHLLLFGSLVTLLRILPYQRLHIHFHIIAYTLLAMTCELFLFCSTLNYPKSFPLVHILQRLMDSDSQFANFPKTCDRLLHCWFVDNSLRWPCACYPSPFAQLIH